MKLHFRIPFSSSGIALSVTRTNPVILRTSSDVRKVFCIGFEKTGTTSLAQALGDLGFELGNQSVGELLAEDWAYRRLDRIIGLCHTAQAFQDVPFGLPGLYRELDENFPGSRFVLTVRDNEEQWFSSLLRFSTKMFSIDGEGPPTVDDLHAANYLYRGWCLDYMRLFYDYPRVPLWDAADYKRRYQRHIADVESYFDGRPDLLVLNVAHGEAYQRLGEFLERPVAHGATFPWLNKT